MGIEEGDLIKGRYEVIEKLGDGCYAKVFLVMDTKPRNNDNSRTQFYAVKAINKRHLKRNRELGPNLYREAKVHKSLDHPNIVKFYKEMDDDTYIYFLLEVVTPGELFKELYERDDDEDSDESEQIGFSETETRNYLKQLISSLIYLRDHNVIHRDLKPENLLVDEEGVLKLADFGWATDRTSRSIVGTDTYNAPEMLKRREYDYRSDIWSLGIVFFEFLYQKRPFKGKNEKQTEKLILRGKVDFPKDPPVSHLAKDLIVRILTLDPNYRPDYEEILAHPWMNLPDQTKKPKPKSRSRSRSQSHSRRASSQASRKSDYSDRSRSRSRSRSREKPISLPPLPELLNYRATIGQPLYY